MKFGSSSSKSNSLVEKESASAVSEKIRVMHVDDDMNILKITKQCLEMEGSIHVDMALSVDEALSKLETEKYDVVVSDYQMPGKDGLDFLKALRQKGNIIPFIVFTGSERENIATKALNLGANQILNKTGEPETVYVELARNIMELAKPRKTEAKSVNLVQSQRTYLDKLL